MLVSTHILSEVQQIADTVTIISRGRLLAEGDVSDILGADGRVAARVGVSDHLRATEVLTASGFTVERLPNRILRVSLVSRKLDLAVITRLLADQGLYVSELTPIQPDLESVFLALGLRASEEGSGYPARSAASGASNQTPDRAPLSWTSEAADTFFVCEQARKAAATPRDPPRAERAIKPRIARRCPGRARQQTRSSSASKRGRQRLPRAIRRERSEQSNTVG